MTSTSVEEIRIWMEWAGAKLLAMHISSPLPREPHTAWPTFAQDARQAYGYTGERLRAAMPRSVEIALMDEILLFPGLIKDLTTRRIVHARALVTPISNRHLYSWTKLAFMLHTNRHRVARLHGLGLHEVCQCLPLEKADAVRGRLLAITM
jgi:hypothetical protein